MANFDSVFAWIVSPSSIVLELALVFLAYRRRLHRQLLFFSIYIFLLIPNEAVGWWVKISTNWFASVGYRYTYWSSQFILSVLRLLTIAEIARRSLRGYPAVWALAWRILSIAALGLSLWTTYSAFQYAHRFRKFLEVPAERFELMQAILLLLVFFLGVYYRVRISRLHQLILIGICIYSAVLVANSQILLFNKAPADSIYGYIRQYSFLVPLAVWTYALWRWGATSNTPPELISQAKYDELSPQIHDRLKELNDKLDKLIKR